MENSFLIVDSGSTKADWVHYPSRKRFTTKGFNPFYYATEEIIQELSAFKDILGELKEVSCVYWYGSGCSNAVKNAVIENALRHFFPGARIVVEHDLLGAARALLGTQKGIACILGTGSNSCLYDGQHIVQNVPSLGFLLGDEGSATHIAKKFLAAYFYHHLSPETSQRFYERYALDRVDFLNALYSSKTPNVMIGQYVEFLSENQDLADVCRIVKESFREFLNCQVSRYEGFHYLPTAFTGSVAWAFRDILGEVMREWNGNLGKIVPKPIEGLYEFHSGEKFLA